MSIEEILIEDNIPDKPNNYATTTHKFKKDLWSFFDKDYFKDVNFIEFGTSRGYTAKIASYLFEHVHTVNVRVDELSAKYLSSRDNITCYGFNLYGNNCPWDKIDSGDVFLIDALHTYDAVTKDIESALTQIPSKKGKKYLVFDDYGAYPGIKRAIEDAISRGVIEEVTRIGQEEGYKYGESTLEISRTLLDSEGIVCREV